METAFTMRPSMARAIGLLAAPWLFALSAGAQPAFKIFVHDSGAYRVTYEDLRAAGLEGAVDSRRLALTRLGEGIPIWVADGGDGVFSPGDRFEFLGDRPAGHRSYYSEHTSLNVYRLELDGSPGSRMTAPASPGKAAAAAAPAPLAVEEHIEKDRMLLRFRNRRGTAPEPWYWQRLTHVDPKPFEHRFWLHRHLEDPDRPSSLRVHLQGWSRAGGELPDHRADVFLNGRLVGGAEWDGEEARLIEVPEVPADVLRGGENVLEILIPKRRPPVPRVYAKTPDAVIDEVILNWIEIRTPRQPRIDAEPVRLVLPDPDGSSPIRLTTAPDARLLVFGADGSRFDRRNMSIASSAGIVSYTFQPPSGVAAFHAVLAGKLRAPLAIELERPAGLKDVGRQADYVIITHPRLRSAIEPLAAFHRQRGLAVAVVQVEQIYDEFNHSLLDPHAIREFLSYAYHEWRRPAPRFVLLVGDASWGGRAGWSGYGIASTREKKEQRRNMIPAGIYHGQDGPVASDNFYVAVDGEDLLPEMAVGRFPVTEPEEVKAIVDKTLGYAAAGVGPWRRSMLWITNNEAGFQAGSDRVAAAAATRGFAGLKVYPSPEDADNAGHQQVLRQAFDQGQLLVHFFGHGGRYIWRTGNTDLRARRDLFTLDHLDQLAPTASLPLVLSMTCYSAPFDHPTADSIGEKFLRLEGRGAVGVLAASWRVSPAISLSDMLLEELSVPGTIGEAILRAKRRFKGPDMVSLYNLLGDPAVELALPEHPLPIVARAEDGEEWRIAATVPDEVGAGRAVVDWLDAAGEVVRSERLEVRDATLEAGFQATNGDAEASSVRVYVWNEAAGVDAMGALELRSDTGS